MFVFSKQGREAYLTFVSRLPAQVMLLSPCFFLPKMKFFHWSDPVDIAMWGTFLILALFAAVANILEFIDIARVNRTALKTVVDLKKSGLSGRNFWAKALRHFTVEIASFIIILLIIYAGLIAVMAILMWNYFPKP